MTLLHDLASDGRHRRLLIFAEGSDQVVDSLVELLRYFLVHNWLALFYFAERDSLLVHQFHVVVHWVGVDRHWQAQVAEVAHTL